jgi:hypothetical protein
VSGLAEDIAKVMTKAIAEIRKLSEDDLKALLAGEGSLKYVSPRHRVELKPEAKPAPPLKVPSAEVRRQLDACESESAAKTYLASVKFPLAQLKRLATELDVRVTGSTAKVIIDDIVRVVVSGRLTRDAIRRS